MRLSAPRVCTLLVICISRNEWSDGTLIQSGHGPGHSCLAQGPSCLVSPGGKPQLFTEVLSSPQLKPVFFGFPLNCVFPNTVCFTSKPNLSSVPKLSWSLKKTVFPTYAESGINSFIPLPPTCTSTWAPMGSETLCISLLASIVDSSSFPLPAFLWLREGCFSLFSLLLFIFYIGQLTKSSVLPFTNKLIWAASSLEKTYWCADY